jgi:hypothetical protein
MVREILESGAEPLFWDALPLKVVAKVFLMAAKASFVL